MARIVPSRTAGLLSVSATIRGDWRVAIARNKLGLETGQKAFIAQIRRSGRSRPLQCSLSRCGSTYDLSPEPVRTTFNRSAQSAAEQSVKSGLERLKRPGLQAALVAIEPRTGNVLAMVGGAD